VTRDAGAESESENEELPHKLVKSQLESVITSPIARHSSAYLLTDTTVYSGLQSARTVSSSPRRCNGQCTEAF
jgi:hypothetical protein